MTTTAMIAEAAKEEDASLTQAWAVLESVPDPEIPIVSIRELGVLRDVRRAADGALEVVITPTYSGCPAMAQIAEDIAQALDAAKLAPVRVLTVLAPAWTTDWIGEAARAKLRAYGIAPPASTRIAADSLPPSPHSPHKTPGVERPIRFVPRTHMSNDVRASPVCPRCGSAHTQRLAQFGSTACKALYRCLDCREPFDYFKPY
jgi:ring-1,2-phenylacetyl-CoA epoxidase subunit PaaD